MKHTHMNETILIVYFYFYIHIVQATGSISTRWVNINPMGQYQPEGSMSTTKHETSSFSDAFLNCLLGNPL
jgi:hypothetical protein